MPAEPIEKENLGLIMFDIVANLLQATNKGVELLLECIRLTVMNH